MNIKLLYIFIGAGLGGLMRYMLTRVVPNGTINGTIAVNLIGCFFAGLFLFTLLNKTVPENITLFIATGVLGGFTTFSAFSIETFSLLQNNHLKLAILNIAISISGVFMTYLGYLFARLF